MAKLKGKTIKKTLSVGRQDVTYTEIIKIKEKKLRIIIKSDSYDFQSSARISVYNEENLEWNHLDSVHYSNMETPFKLYYHSFANEYSRGINKKENETILMGHFSYDRTSLFNTAQEII
jgi:hypothetical protein